MAVAESKGCNDTCARCLLAVYITLTDFDLARLDGGATVVNLADVDSVSHVARDVEAQSYDVLALKPDTHCLRALWTYTESRE